MHVRESVLPQRFTLLQKTETHLSLLHNVNCILRHLWWFL